MPIEEYYSTLHERTERLVHLKRKQLRTIAFLRLLVFVALAWFVYLAFASSVWFIVGSVITLFVFLVLMKQHARADHELAFNTSLHTIAKHGSKPFYKTATGNEYDQAEHAYSSDFDLFGNASLFQYINVTETAPGEKRLAHTLLYPLTDPDGIRKQQDAIRELSGDADYIMKSRSTCALIGNHSELDIQLRSWLNAPLFFSTKKITVFLLYLVPAFSLASLAAVFFFHYFTPVVFAMLINWFIAGLYLKRVNKIHAVTGKQKAVLENFGRLNARVSERSFESEKLRQLKQSFVRSGDSLQQLHALAATFDQRLNTMLGPVLNSLFLFDLQCVYRIEKWQQKNAAQLQQWMDDMAEMEMLVTMGTYAFNHPQYVYPELKNGGIYFDSEGLVHPLINGKESVSNNFSFDETNKVFIITGSNMSGKSTFLRTIGVSLLTAMAGLPVHAKRFVFAPVKLLSSMRIADSLQESTSYFYAELKRLKVIMDETEKPGLPSVLFIDEMLKGTNSKEKLDGSVAIIEKLMTKPCISFIATHDLALGSLEQEFPGKVVNYSFESAIVNNDLVFDYKIKGGVASSTNATFLLRKMDIV